MGERKTEKNRWTKIQKIDTEKERDRNRDRKERQKHRDTKG
jgi:hypothetical protein